MAKDKAEVIESATEIKKLSCGIIMPISAIDGCSAEHWKEVQEFIKEATRNAGFEPSLVSDADDVGIIQKRIIQNIYNNPIVVCDVSGKNPNVMFELGMRLAFDKPAIIVKDDKTTYSFDTAPIEHLEYPRDLRYQQIVQFKETLREKIQATYNRATADKNFTTFLKNFGEFTVAQIPEKEVSSDKFILQAIEDLRSEMRQFYNRSWLERELLLERNRLVAGKVSSQDNGSPLRGVNVVLRGTTIGTVTDTHGIYKLKVPSSGGTLKFSCIGFTSQEVAIGEQVEINIVLSSL